MQVDSQALAAIRNFDAVVKGTLVGNVVPSQQQQLEVASMGESSSTTHQKGPSDSSGKGHMQDYLDMHLQPPNQNSIQPESANGLTSAALWQQSHADITAKREIHHH